MDEQSLNNYVVKVIKNLKTVHNFGENVVSEVSSGAELGDGYSSKKIIVSLKEEHGREMDFFLKCYQLSNDVPALVNMFKNEATFYEEVQQVFYDFQIARGIEDISPITKYFDIGTIESETKPKPIVLENLKLQGYRLRDRTNEIDEDHMDLALKSLARYHAVSFAMKDQDRELFEQITKNVVDCYYEDLPNMGYGKVIESLVKSFLANLDPVEDEKILNAANGLPEKFNQYTSSKYLPPDSYAVLLHGDTWTNNMMFLYDNLQKPTDIRFVDFQLIRLNSLAIDVSYFFYTTATPQMLNNVETYMQKYHKYLSNRIEELGSDLQKLYPYDVFKQHWKKYSIFGLISSFFLVKAMLFEKQEVPLYFESVQGGDPQADLFSFKSKREEQYVERMRRIFLHFLDNELLC